MTEPDDPKAKDGVLYVIFGVLALPIIAIAIGSFVVLPVFAAAFWIKGVERGSGLYRVLGTALGALWLAYLWWISRRLGRARPEDREETPSTR